MRLEGTLAQLLFLFGSSTSAFLSHGSITVRCLVSFINLPNLLYYIWMDIIWMVNVVFRKDTDGCDWDIAYSGIQVVQYSLSIAVEVHSISVTEYDFKL